MIRSLGRAENAMLLQQARIETMANNLANVNSAGFRQILTRTSEPSAPESGGPGALRVPVRAPAEPTLLQALDTRPGSLQATGRDTDVALMGPGFFAVQTPAGVRYTRAGSFLLDGQQRLVTPSGALVLGDGGPVTVGGGKLSVAADGTVSVDGQSRGRLRVVDFAEPERLQHEGSSLLRAPEDLEARTLDAAEVTLAQGHVEGSNVSAVDTLVAMIAAQRAFEVQSKVLTTQDEMLDKSVNTMPRVNRG